MTVSELREAARTKGLSISGTKKEELVGSFLQKQGDGHAR